MQDDAGYNCLRGEPFIDKESVIPGEEKDLLRFRHNCHGLLLLSFIQLLS